jgi:Rieske Fe-S protein
MNDGPTRREFCGSAGRALSVGALGGSVASLLQACGGGASSPTGTSGSFGGSALPSISGTAASGAVTVPVAGSPLATVGGSALVRTSSGTFLVARTAQDAFTALTAICTHEDCTITDVSGQTYVCPCHGSRFSQTGQVQNGPATRALRSFATRFAGDVLTITL